MNPDDVKKLIEEKIPGCEIEVDVDGSHVSLVVISDQFDGLNTLKKQQMVYGALNAAIADGRIHAVHMKTLTPAEWTADRA